MDGVDSNWTEVIHDHVQLWADISGTELPCHVTIGQSYILQIFER